MIHPSPSSALFVVHKFNYFIVTARVHTQSLDFMSSVLNSLAPLKTCAVSFIHTVPWYTSELRQLKTTGCRLERQYSKSGLADHKQMYSDHILYKKNALCSAKSTYSADIIRTGEGNMKTLFTIHSLLKSPETLALHYHSDEHCSAF